MNFHLLLFTTSSFIWTTQHNSVLVVYICGYTRELEESEKKKCANWFSQIFSGAQCPVVPFHSIKMQKKMFVVCSVYKKKCGKRRKLSETTKNTISNCATSSTSLSVCRLGSHDRYPIARAECPWQLFKSLESSHATLVERGRDSRTCCVCDGNWVSRELVNRII